VCFLISAVISIFFLLLFLLLLLAVLSLLCTQTAAVRWHNNSTLRPALRSTDGCGHGEGCWELAAVLAPSARLFDRRQTLPIFFD
jgi:hypothetical protein